MNQEQLLEKLKEAWSKTPHKRLGELLVELYDDFAPPGHREERVQMAGGHLWNAPDQELYTMLDRFAWKNTPLS